ncbi:MAG TPA: FlgD immunoglobulin-like domain containing protein [Candidatus Krumholzibacteria bacterium]
MRTAPLVLIALCALLASSSVFAAGPITSGTTVSGSVSGPSYLESWTFSGTAGNRILVTAITTSGALNTSIVLKAPGGGAVEANTNSGDRLDWQLVATGTYTIQIEDFGLNDAGNYAIAFLNVTAGPLTGGGDTDGGAIVSADIKTGTMSGPGDLDAFTFTASNNHRIIVDAVATSGAGYNTYLSLYPPNGGAAVTYTSGDRLEFQLNAAGTWTIVVEDNADDTAGGYSVSMLNITAGPISNGGDTDGGAIAANQIRTGNIQDGVDFDAFTFFGFAGSRVVVTGLATGGTLNTNLSLYPANGMPAEVSTNSGDVIDWQILTTGTYTVLVEDYGNDNTGTYTISLTNITTGPYTDAGDPDGGLLASGEVKNGTTSGVGDIDVFTFGGTFGDRVLIDAVATSGASFNTYMAVYPPNGGPSPFYTSGDRLDMQLNASGLWTVLVFDNGFDNAGGYSLSLLNVTAGPLTSSGDSNGGAIASSEIKNAQFQQGVDFDAFTFNGTAGARVIFLGLATGGGTHNTTMTLYPPGGGAAEVATNSGDAIDTSLLATGTYTLVIEDYGNDNAGTYTLSYLNLTAGPLTNGGDTDGGAIASADVKSGSMSGVADLDAFTFTGAVGDRVVIDAVATGGAGFNTYIALYPPGGGAAVTYTSADRMEWQLGAAGTWTILMQDNGDDTAGNYDLSLLNVTSGPHTNGSDGDGFVLISNSQITGEFDQGVDLDAYTFNASAGQRVILVGLATGVGSHNTNLTLYPPNGGAAETTTNSGDVIDWPVLQTGKYTLVIEDYGDDNPGSYVLSFLNLTAGPLTDGSDTDGGPITSAVVKTGSIGTTADFDAFTFTGNIGDRILMNAVATSGVNFNTYMGLYPPNGGASPAYTSADRMEYQLTASGTWTFLVFDNGFDHTGGYEISVLNLTSGPLTTAGDADGGTILSNEIKTGQSQQGADFDVFSFAGTAGQRVILAGVSTGGGVHNTTLTLYPPGGLAAEVSSNSGDRIEAQLLRSGTYKLVIEDYGDDHTGAYTVSYLNVTNGPLTNGGDTNGGAIVSNQLVSGTMSGVGDLDGYTFSGTYGQRVVVAAVATSGAGFNTNIALYPPNGSGSPSSTSSDRLDFQLNSSGTWTIVIEDTGDDTAGGYTMSFLNVTAGPYSGSGETDGGAIADNVQRNGSIYSVSDLDAYTFYGVAGMTATISAIATSGTLNTQLALYPPNGLPAIQFTSGDNIAPVLATNGYYTLVIDDLSEDETGNYSVTVNTSGGVTGTGDTPAPAELALHPAVPSPFSQSTRFDYDLPADDHVRLDVYDVGGRRVRSLADEDRPAGRHAATWDGRDLRGARVASGVYYLRMQTRAGVKLQKVVLVR